MLLILWSRHVAEAGQVFRCQLLKVLLQNRESQHVKVGNLSPAYWRWQANFLLRRGTEAGTEFQKLL